MRKFVRVLPGEYPSFSAFYVEHVPTVVAFLKKAGAHDADIPDITQQVFLKIHKYWDKPPVDQDGMSLETICEQQAAEHYRLCRNQFELPEPNVGVDMPTDDDNAQTQLERHEFDVIVKQVLASMEPDLRNLLVRHEFEDEPIQTIANSQNIARTTAYARLAEAKKIFRLRAAKILGEKPYRMLLLPWATATSSADGDVSPEFIEAVHQRVWPGLARKLGYDEHNPPPLPARDTESEPPRSGEHRIRADLPIMSTPLGRVLLQPILLLSAVGLGGVGGAWLWPPQSVLIAKHTPSLLGDIVIIGGKNEEAAAAPPAPVARAVPLSTSPAPKFDHDMLMLNRARGQLAQGQYDKALATLKQHEQQFPRSEHAETRSHYLTLARQGQKQAAAAATGSD